MTESERSDASDDGHLGVWVAIILLGWFTLEATVYALQITPLDYADERGHVALAWWLAEYGRAWPDYPALSLIDAKGRFADFPNYINHPPVYYWSQALVLSLGQGLDFGQRVILARLSNVLIVGTALAVLARAVYRWRSSAPELGLVLGLSWLLPGLVVVQAGTVTNDNLAFVGGVAVGLGAIQLIRGRDVPWGWVLLGAGFGLAAATKLTAGLQFGLLVAGLFTIETVRTRAAVWRQPAFALGVVLAASGLLPSLANLAAYGTILPPVSRPEDIMAWWHDAFGVHHWADQRLDLCSYVIVFFQSLFITAMPGLERHQWAWQDAWTFGIYPIFLVVGAAGVVRAARHALQNPDDRMAQIVFLAALSTASMVLAHLVFAYRGHLETGYLRGIWSRYYYPGLPLLGLACLYALDGMRDVKRRRIVTWVLFLGVVLYRVLTPRFQEWHPFDDVPFLF